MTDIVERLRNDPISWKMCMEAADEIVRLRDGVKCIDDAITAYARSIGKSRESLAIQNHEPAWLAWKALCDELREPLHDRHR